MVSRGVALRKSFVGFSALIVKSVACRVRLHPNSAARFLNDQEPRVAQTSPYTIRYGASRSMRSVRAIVFPEPRAGDPRVLPLRQCSLYNYWEGKARGKLGDRGQVTGNGGEGIDDWRLMNAEW